MQSDIVELQKEKADLRKEIMFMQTEGNNGLASSIQDESSDDTSQLKEMIQHKNKHILQLLSDIQVRKYYSVHSSNNRSHIII